VVAVSSFPGVELPDVGSGGIDKLLHFLQYAILGFLVSRGWGPLRANRDAGIVVWIPAAILLAFAGMDEYHQRWIPGRSPEWWDWTADALGVMTGYMLGVLANHRAAHHSGSRG
jgi:VanZ family protein